MMELIEHNQSQIEKPDHATQRVAILGEESESSHKCDDIDTLRGVAEAVLLRYVSDK